MEVFLLQENRYVILLSSQNSVSSTQWEEKACSLVHELHTVFQNYLNADTCYGVSSAVSKFSALPEAFEHARYSLQLHYFQPDRFLIKEMRKPDRTMSRPEVRNALSISISVCRRSNTRKSFPDFMLSSSGCSSTTGRTWTLWGCRTFSPIWCAPSPAGGKGAGRNGGKASGLRNRGGSAAFP